MRKFNIYITNDDIHMYRIRVKANTINGALKKSHKIRKNLGYHYVYQIETRVKGYSSQQPVWDFFNGNISNYFRLKL